MNHPEEIKDYIKRHSYLFWWIKESDKEKISLDLLVESILNYGDIPDIKELFNLIGIDKVAQIFYKQISGKRDNYHPRTIDFFKLVFENYAQGNINKRTN